MALSPALSALPLRGAPVAPCSTSGSLPHFPALAPAPAPGARLRGHVPSRIEPVSIGAAAATVSQASSRSNRVAHRHVCYAKKDDGVPAGGAGGVGGGGYIPSLDIVADSSQHTAETFSTSTGRVESVHDDKAEIDFLGESTEGNLHLVEAIRTPNALNIFGMHKLDDILTIPLNKLKAATQAVLDVLDVPESFPDGNPQRAIYCSRTLNLRSIKSIGYDMDYTLIHYDVNAWEGRAYEYGLDTLRQQGVPVDGLKFDPDLVIRGLIMDKDHGNLIKVDRFGLVKRAMHGTRMMSWQEIRELYGREVVNLRNEGRWVFLNTLFSVSEAVMYSQLVDRLDQGMFITGAGNISYQALYKMVAKALYRTHVEGKLKAEIIQAPERYVELDPEMAQTLLDQKDSGKHLLLITNSDYEYTNKMMSYAYDRFLPKGMTWRDLFDMVIVMARKPDFFNYQMSLYEVVTPEGLMRPVLAARKGGLYCGGSARMVEKALGVEGDDVLYVGDHIYTDAALAKINFRWRTALIIRELEREVDALALGRPHRDALKELMSKKELVGDVFNQLRLARQRFVAGHSSNASFDDEEGINETLAQLLMVMEHLDDRIGPMLEQDGSHFNKRWGYLSRAGLNDKSQLCRQIEKYADIYTSRVSNFLRYTPYMYFRSPSQSLAHDRNLSKYYKKAYPDQATAGPSGNGTSSGSPSSPSRSSSQPLTSSSYSSLTSMGNAHVSSSSSTGSRVLETIAGRAGGDATTTSSSSSASSSSNGSGAGGGGGGNGGYGATGVIAGGAATLGAAANLTTAAARSQAAEVVAAASGWPAQPADEDSDPEHEQD